jgi:hypothetical protein
LPRFWAFLSKGSSKNALEKVYVENLLQRKWVGGEKKSKAKLAANARAKAPPGVEKTGSPADAIGRLLYCPARGGGGGATKKKRNFLDKITEGSY